MKHRLIILVAHLALGVLHASDRVALVIGNNAYQNGSQLRNPINDAKAVAAALKGAGFEVLVAEDAGLAVMEQKLLEFSRAAKGAKAAWFHYSGHGAEVKGTNYLIPVDAAVQEEFQVKHKTLALDQVLAAMDNAGAPLKVVVLDCCRDNPFGKSWSRSGSKGLAQIGETPRGTIIAFATAPGKTAADGSGQNSPYTSALVQALASPGLEVDQVFKLAGKNVLTATKQQQQPWVNSSFFDSFVVVHKTAIPSSPSQLPVGPSPRPLSIPSVAAKPQGQEPSAAATGTVPSRVSVQLKRQLSNYTSWDFSPDRKLILLGGVHAEILDASTLTRVGVPMVHPNSPNGCRACFSPDGKYIFLHDKFKEAISVWHAATQSQNNVVIRGKNSAKGAVGINDYSVSPKGDKIATNGGYWVEIWDIKTGKQIGKTIPNESAVWSAPVWSPDGKTILVENCNDEVQAFNSSTGSPISKKMTGVSGLCPPIFSADGHYVVISVVSGNQGEHLQLWNSDLTQKVGRKLVQSEATESVFSSDGKLLIVASKDKVVAWNVATQSRVWETPLQSKAYCDGFNFDPTGRYLCASFDLIDSDKFEVVIYEALSGKIIITMQDKSSAEFAGDSSTLLAWPTKGDTLDILSIVTH